MMGTDEIPKPPKRTQYEYFPASPAIVVEDKRDDSGEVVGYNVQINGRGKVGYLPWHNLPRWHSPLDPGDAVAVLARRKSRRRMPTLIHPETLLAKKTHGTKSLATLLCSPNPDVRRATLNVCQELYAVDLPEVLSEAISERLCDEDERVRFAAIRMVRSVEKVEDFAEVLVAIAKSDGLLANQVAALRALESAKVDSTHVTNAFEFLIQHGHPTLRASAWRAQNTVAPEQVKSQPDFEECYNAAVADVDSGHNSMAVCDSAWLSHSGIDEWRQDELEWKALQDPLKFFACIQGHWERLPNSTKQLARSICFDGLFVAPATCDVFTEILLSEEHSAYSVDHLRSYFPDEETAESLIACSIRNILAVRPELRERLCMTATGSTSPLLRRIALSFMHEWPILKSTEVDAIVTCILNEETRPAALNVMAGVKNSSQVILPRILDAMSVAPSTFPLDPNVSHINFFEHRVITEFQHSFRLVEDSLATN